MAGRARRTKRCAPGQGTHQSPRGFSEGRTIKLGLHESKTLLIDVTTSLRSPQHSTKSHQKSLFTMASANFAMNSTEQRRVGQFAANLPKPTFQVGLSEGPTFSHPGEDCRGSSRPAILQKAECGGGDSGAPRFVMSALQYALALR